jgi:hypothetical protein
MNGGATNAPPFIVFLLSVLSLPPPQPPLPTEICKALTVPLENAVETLGA